MTIKTRGEYLSGMRARSAGSLRKVIVQLIELSDQIETSETCEKTEMIIKEIERIRRVFLRETLIDLNSLRAVQSISLPDLIDTETYYPLYWS